MKFSCATQDFLESLQLVSRAIGGQQALPILGNILMDVKGGVCTVSATDLELSIVTSFNASIESEGTVTVPAKAMLNFVQFNTDAEMVLEVKDGTQVKVSSKHAKASIAGEAASEYPTISPVDKQSEFSIGIGPLLEALHLVTFSSAKTTLRPVLSGVYMRRNATSIILAATDSYRLSEYTIAMDDQGADMSCIIPVKVLDELRVVLGGMKAEKKEKKSKEGGVRDEEKKSDKVSIALGRQQIEISVGRTRLLSRLIDGKFPNYEQIIPKESATTVQLSLTDFMPAVKRMHYFAKEVNNNLTFHFKQGESRIFTPQTPAGRDEAMLATEVTGGENKIALSSSYLLDFLNHIDSESVTMHMQDSQHPAVFKIPGNDKYLHLIMPLRMQEE
jgi:DNA polymerase-3 subunit beta